MWKRVVQPVPVSCQLRLSLVVLSAITLAGCSTIPRGLAPIQPQLLSLDMVQEGFEGQSFDVELLLTNPNEADIPVRRLEFDVRLAGEGLLAGETAVPFTLPGQGRETVQIQIFSEIVSSVSRLMSLTQGPENTLSYELQGQLTLDVGLRDPVAIASRGQVPLTVRGNSP